MQKHAWVWRRGLKWSKDQYKDQYTAEEARPAPHAQQLRGSCPVPHLQVPSTRPSSQQPRDSTNKRYMPHQQHGQPHFRNPHQVIWQEGPRLSHHASAVSRRLCIYYTLFKQLYTPHQPQRALSSDPRCWPDKRELRKSCSPHLRSCSA